MQEDGRTGGYREKHLPGRVAMIQDSDNIVVSTIVAPVNVDKPHLQTELYLS